MAFEPSRQLLADEHCWEDADVVPRQPEMSAFRRRLRYQQAQWREANGHPIGTQPIVPKHGKPSRPLGSRIPLDYARQTGANFLTAAAHDAATARLAAKERHQMLDEQRLWADLLSSMPMCFNLFGDLAADPMLADRAVHTLWPDAPGEVTQLRFEHSPGRLDADYLGNLTAFDVAVVLDVDDGRRAIIGVETKYHEWAKPETAKPTRLDRYRQVAEASEAFVPGVEETVNGTGLLQIWLDHLLVLSMLQHHSGQWAWGRFVLVYPEANSDVAAACERYQQLLVDRSTFTPLTIEEMLAADVLPATSTTRFCDRYLPR